jgi:hypothetical protein
MITSREMRFFSILKNSKCSNLITQSVLNVSRNHEILLTGVINPGLIVASYEASCSFSEDVKTVIYLFAYEKHRSNLSLFTPFSSLSHAHQGKQDPSLEKV